MRTLIGVSGASGAVFAVDFLKRCPGERFLIVSDWGRAVLKDELDLTPKDLVPPAKRLYPDNDLSAPFSSGTNRYDAMVIVPCSVSTLSKIAVGIGDTLITRSAHVALKERMRLILALRETPLSTGALENALKLSREGAIIAPIMPPFYTRPKSLEEVVAGYTEKLLALVGAPVQPGWRADSLEG
jgi:flavin prenyltransferase